MIEFGPGGYPQQCQAQELAGNLARFHNCARKFRAENENYDNGDKFAEEASFDVTGCRIATLKVTEINREYNRKRMDSKAASLEVWQKAGISSSGSNVALNKEAAETIKQQAAIMKQMQTQLDKLAKEVKSVQKEVKATVNSQGDVQDRMEDIGRMAQVILADRNMMVANLARMDNKIAAVESLAGDIIGDLGTVANHIRIGDVERRTVGKFNVEAQGRMRDTTRMLLTSNSLTNEDADGWMGPSEKEVTQDSLPNLKALKKLTPTLQQSGTQVFGSQQLTGMKRQLITDGSVPMDGEDGGDMAASPGGGVTPDGK